MHGVVRGGTATLTAVFKGQTLTMIFYIRGLNPTHAEVWSYLQSANILLEPLYIYLIGENESNLHQFNST